MRHLTNSFFTYTLGQSLYVPLTHRCNSLTLPETRGPNFVLPPQVVASLLRVRDAETINNKKWTSWCTYLDGVDTYQKLPPPEYNRDSEDYDTHYTEHDDDRGDDDNHYQVQVNDLMEEILQQQQHFNVKSIVFSGEGEPTIRFDDLLELARKLRDEPTTSSLPLRLTTNGLEQSKDSAKKLYANGITQVSIALMTAESNQYDEIMKPSCVGGHSQVISFIEQAIDTGLDVEITAVDRDRVDKQKLEDLVQSLQVDKDVRWRSFFA